jgi:hypothetical protein
MVRAQAHLGLDAVDLVVLLNMNMHWWKKGDFPFPRPTIIAIGNQQADGAAAN